MYCPSLTNINVADNEKDMERVELLAALFDPMALVNGPGLRIVHVDEILVCEEERRDAKQYAIEHQLLSPSSVSDQDQKKH